MSAATQLVPLRRDYRYSRKPDAVSGSDSIAPACWSQKNSIQVSQGCHSR